MFPIIPQYYVGKSSPDCVIEYGLTPVHVQVPKMPESKTYSKAERRTGVVVSSAIEKNIESEDISVDEILGRRADNKHSTEEVS